ncbi:MAG: response regulator [Saprospiraceae bacterium]|nr:response regulator [Saprospiraceae bacterium]
MRILSNITLTFLLLALAIADILPAQPGYRIEKYDTQNGLQSHWVSAVQQDPQGFIWLALKDGMLARFDGHSFVHFPMNEQERMAFGGNTLLNLWIDPKGRFLVMIQEKSGLFNPKTGRFTLLPAEQNEVVIPEGFKEVDKSRPWTNDWEVLREPLRIKRNRTGDTYTLDGISIIYQVLDTGNEIWIAAFEGLYKISPRRHLFETIQSRPFDIQKGMVTGRSCYGMTETGGYLWYIADKALWRAPVDHPDQSTQVMDAAVLGGFYSLYADRTGGLWPGRYSAGMIRMNAANPAEYRNFSPPEPSRQTAARSFLEMPDGNMWAATDQGILEMDPANRRTAYIEKEQIGNVWQFYRAANNDIWVATENGLFQLRLQNDAYHVANHYYTGNCAGMGSNKLLSVQEAGGYLWLGSDGGLIRFAMHEPSAATRTFTTADGLPNNKVYYAMPDGKYLWAGTDWGLARISLESAMQPEDLPEIRTFHVDDGLPHEEFNSLAFFRSPSSGKIFLGGLNGISVFQPQDLQQTTAAEPPLLFTSFEKYDQKHDTTLSFSLLQRGSEPVVLEYYDQFFTISFALLSYTDPRHHRYLYQMEGFEKNWNAVGSNNFARYTALPPGTYTFKVRAADHNGNWVSGTISLPIIVRQAWYRSGWAWAMYLLGFGLVLYTFWLQRLRQVRLQARAEQLEALDDFKSKFFTNITHEFRTPLTVILGTTAQLEKEQVSQTWQHKLGLVKRNGENLLQLINQMLDLAKLEDKSLKMNYIQGDVVAFVRYVCESLQSLAHAQNILIRVETTALRMVIDYDPKRLQQIVYNLLSNAIKFTPSGGEVLLKMETTDYRNAPGFMLHVSDTGMGIPTAELPHIFDRFYQVDQHSSTGGTGIGLALTRELVKALGGGITVKSELGRGAIFTVQLPVTNQAPQVQPNEVFVNDAILPVVPPSPVAPETAPRLLLIEDNPDVMEYLRTCLAGKYRLDFASNGKAGIEKAFENAPDLVVSDVMMPEKDGFEVCEALKNDARTSHVPVVLLTARADVESRIAGLRRGADAYLAKPFQEEELLVTLEKLLENQRRLHKYYFRLALGQESDVAEIPLHTEPDFENTFLKHLREAVETRLDDAELTAEEIGRVIGMSRSNLYAKLSALTGLSFNLYLRELRLKKAQELLRSTDLNIAEVAYAVGFNDPKYFSKLFSEALGVSPKKFRSEK